MDGEVGDAVAVAVDFDDGCVVGGSGLVVLIPADLTGRVGEGSAHGAQQAEGVVGRRSGVGVDRDEVELSFAWVKSVMMSAPARGPEFGSEVKREVSLPAPAGQGVLPEPADQGVVAGIAYQRVVAAEPSARCCRHCR